MNVLLELTLYQPYEAPDKPGHATQHVVRKAVAWSAILPAPVSGDMVEIDGLAFQISQRTLMVKDGFTKGIGYYQVRVHAYLRSLDIDTTLTEMQGLGWLVDEPTGDDDDE